MIIFAIMAGRPQETTRLKTEATSASINNRKCVSAACLIHDFIDKNCNIFVFKVKKLDE